MNYETIYDNIINKAKDRNALKGGDIILESHHIIPKACGGTNDKDNLVNLTTREHYIVHVLLSKIYKETEYQHKMIRAAFLMSRGKVNNSRMYERIKDIHIHNLRNQIISNKHKEAISKANAGNKVRLGMKNSETQQEAIKKYNNNKIVSEESKLKMSESQIKRFSNNDVWNKGVIGYTINYPEKRLSRGPHSIDTLNKMSISQLNREQIQCPHCPKIGTKNVMVRWHFNNCKRKSNG
jgi:hypothetical protein